MRVVFLIGNGFDINLGIKTSYLDFFKFYKEIESKNNLIIELKKLIEKDVESWADLEFELGKHTINYNSKEEFIEVFEDIGDCLVKYLKEQEDNFDFGTVDKNALFEYLSYPENSLPPAQKNQIKEYRKKWNNHHWITNIITFNYTRVLEKISDNNGQSQLIGEHLKSKITLENIEHIHGYVDSRMVFGVNDISQIANVKFREDQDILDAFVKKQCNQAMQHTIDEACERQLNNANIICLFGSSLGKTDKMWWELIGNRLKQDCILIIFYYDKTVKISPLRDYKKNASRNNIKNLFLNETQLNNEEKESVKNKIFIEINGNIFGGMRTTPPSTHQQTPQTP